MAPLYGFLSHSSFGLHAAFARDVDVRLADVDFARVVSEASLAHLPRPVQRYLHVAGVVGQPRVRNVFARLHGRIRRGPSGRWMPIRAEQFNFAYPPARFFYLTSSMWGLPVQGYHRYAGPNASMAVRVAGILPVADVSGPVMTESETVTLLNDMCVLAPGMLVTPAISWAADDRRALATFTNAGCVVRAELVFNDDGELVDFISDDRSEIGADGQCRKRRWRTPLGPYRAFGPMRLASRGEARWGAPGDEYAYIELTIDEVRYNQRRHPLAGNAR